MDRPKSDPGAGPPKSDHVTLLYYAGHGRRDDDQAVHLLPPDGHGQHRLQPHHVRLPQRTAPPRRLPGRAKGSSFIPSCRQFIEATDSPKSCFSLKLLVIV